jgi:hypothetical protein
LLVFLHTKILLCHVILFFFKKTLLCFFVHTDSSKRLPSAPFAYSEIFISGPPEDVLCLYYYDYLFSYLF